MPTKIPYDQPDVARRIWDAYVANGYQIEATYREFAEEFNLKKSAPIRKFINEVCVTPLAEGEIEARRAVMVDRYETEISRVNATVAIVEDGIRDLESGAALIEELNTPVRATVGQATRALRAAAADLETFGPNNETVGLLGEAVRLIQQAADAQLKVADGYTKLSAAKTKMAAQLVKGSDAVDRKLAAIRRIEGTDSPQRVHVEGLQAPDLGRVLLDLVASADAGVIDVSSAPADKG